MDDLRFHILTVTEAVSLADNWPLWMFSATCATTHCW